MEPKYFPTIQLTSQQLPPIKDWEVGKRYVLEVVVEMTGVRQAEKYDLPTQEAAEGAVQNNSIKVGTLEIQDVMAVDGKEIPKEEENENDPSTYEADYAEKMDPSNRDSKIVININK
jgi:hypothetical protein